MVREITLTPEGILRQALAKEREAFSYYDGMLKASSIEIIKDLLQELKNEEYKHIKMIESRLARLAVG
jgi:rubrerythrin